MTPSERSDRAKQLLDDPVLQGAFRDIRDRLVTLLESSQYGDSEAHHETAITLKLLKQVQTQLQQYLNDAVIADAKAKDDNWIKRMRQSVRV